jgi:nucleoside-diphosphate-sugar epimerase
MRILVTGATGVIGRRIVPRLVEAGHEVSASTRGQEKRRGMERIGARPVELDLLDRDSVKRAVAGQDVVINLATHMPGSTLQFFLPWKWHENDLIRREGAHHIAEEAAAAGVGRLIQESFAPAYPDRGAEWIDESVPLSPTKYNKTIIDAENAAEWFGSRGGTAIVARFAAFYGSDARHVIDMLKSIEKGWAPLPGAPDAYISSVSHDDAAAAIVAALDLPSGTYNIADDEPVTRQEYFRVIAEAIGVPEPKPLPRWTLPLMGSLGELMARSDRISNRKLREAGFRPTYPSVREGWPVVIEEMRHAGTMPGEEHRAKAA